MRLHALVVFLWVPFACGACGGTIASDPDLDGAPDGGRDGAPRDGSRYDTVGDDTGGDGAVVSDTWWDPGCPDAPLPPTDYACDPFASSSCKAGEACYPFVVYPTQPCEHERYGSRCLKAGSGKQGAPCSSVTGCAATFICVVTGAGNQCVKLCKPGKAGTCPEGLVCSPLDVPGYGGCL